MESQLRALIRDLQSVRDSIVRSDDECCAFLEDDSRGAAGERAQPAAVSGAAPPRSEACAAAAGVARALLARSHGIARSPEASKPCSRCCTFSTARNSTVISARRRLPSRPVKSLLTAHTDALLGPSPKERGGPDHGDDAELRRAPTTRSSAISWPPAWTACGSIAPMTTRRPGSGSSIISSRRSAN